MTLILTIIHCLNMDSELVPLVFRYPLHVLVSLRIKKTVDIR